MWVQDSERSIFEDSRAVVPVIGFILIFGMLVVGLTMYQAQIVPEQNAQVEFQHFDAVQNDLVVVSNSITTAGQTDATQFVGVELGTTYPTRVATINPPPPTGTLRTSEPYNISISNDTTTANVTTRFLEYRPGYYELDTGTIWYEHSVLYLERPDQNETVIINDQRLVDDETLRATALQNEIQETGVDEVTLELYTPDNTTADEIPDGNVTVKIPTRLNGSEYWDDALGDTEQYNEVNTSSFPDADSVYTLNMSVNATNLTLNTVGIRGKPTEAVGKQNIPMPGAGESSDDDADPDPGEVIADVRIENVIKDEPDQTQQFEIDLAADLSTGETISFDLGETGTDIDYPTGESQYSVPSGSGDASPSGTPTADEIVYTAGGDDTAGDTIKIEGSEVDVDAIGSEKFNVTVDSLGGTQNATFLVVEDGYDPSEYDGGDVYLDGDLGVPQREAITGDVIADDVDLSQKAEVTGRINASGDVTFSQRATAGDITAGGGVSLSQRATAGDINTAGGVSLSQRATAGDITAVGDVSLSQRATVGDINTDGGVSLGQRSEAGNISAGNDVTLNQDATAGSIQSDGTVDLGQRATVTGDVTVSSGDNLSCGSGSTINSQSCEDYKAANY